MKNWMPKAADVARETIIILAATVIASAIVGHWPQLRAWLKEQREKA